MKDSPVSSTVTVYKYKVDNNQECRSYCIVGNFQEH